MGKYHMPTAMVEQLNRWVQASISLTMPPPKAIGHMDALVASNLCKRRCGVYAFHAAYSQVSLIMCVESVFKILKM